MKHFNLMIALAAILAAGLASAQQQEGEATPPPSQEDVSGTDVRIENPPPKPAELTSRAVTVPGAPADRNRQSVDAGPLKGVRAVWIRNGEARLIMGGSERTVRPGDAIGTDVVTGVVPERVTLIRSAKPGTPPGDAIVVVSFDAQGKGKVRVYSSKDSTATVPTTQR